MYNLNMRLLLQVDSPIQSRLYQIISDAHLAFNEARRVAETPFPFPFAQITVAMISFWSVLTPIVVAQFFVGSYVISFATSFVSTWMLFAVNEAASQLGTSRSPAIYSDG